MEVRPRMAGKVVLVTGAGHGIGRSVARRLGAEGAKVVAVDLRAAELHETMGLLGQASIEAIGVEGDVSDPASVTETAKAAESRFGEIDVLVNNAGVVIAGSVHELRLEDWDRVFSVNVRGALLMCRAVLPNMIARGQGVIVNTASISGLVGEPHLAAYNSSKGAVVNFTRHMAVDYGKAGIRCNCVCPGWIDTGFNQPIFDASDMSDQDVATLVTQTVPLNRQGTPDEVAAAVAFLASDDASYVSGHALVVDGGQMAL